MVRCPPFETDPKRLALLNAVRHYLSDRTAFFNAWQDSDTRRAMFTAFAEGLGWDDDTLARLVAEDMTGLAGLGATLSVDVVRDVHDHTPSYGGNKLYIASVSPVGFPANVATELTVGVIIADADPVLHLVSADGKTWVPMPASDVSIVGARRTITATVTAPTAGEWRVRAAVPPDERAANSERSDTYPVTVVG